jgi:hypothetical protein
MSSSMLRKLRRAFISPIGRLLNAAVSARVLFELQPMERRLFAGTLLSPAGEVQNPVGSASTNYPLHAAGPSREHSGKASQGILAAAIEPIADALTQAAAGRGGGGRGGESSAEPATSRAHADQALHRSAAGEANAAAGGSGFYDAGELTHAFSNAIKPLPDRSGTLLDEVQSARATPAEPRQPSKPPLPPSANAAPAVDGVTSAPGNNDSQGKPTSQKPSTSIGSGNNQPTSASSSLQTLLAGPLEIGCDDGLTGWTIFESGGTSAGRGTVTHANGGITLVEGDSHLVEASTVVAIPASPSTIVFEYEDLLFDTTASAAFVRDAVEFALLDEVDRSLVRVIGANRDSFLNFTEGMSSLAASGATLTETDPTAGAVSLDISHVAPGTQARFVT